MSCLDDVGLYVMTQTNNCSFFSSFVELEYFSTIFKTYGKRGNDKAHHLVKRKEKKLLASSKLNNYWNALTTVEKDKT